MSRNLSQPQIDRRKKAGAQLTRVTSGLGLAGLGVLGAGAVAKPLARTGRFARITEAKAEKFKDVTGKKAAATSVVAGGIGGINGFNNASWQSAEARQRKKNIVKSYDYHSPFEEGYFGEEGDKQEFSKAFDAERNRLKRNDIEQGVAYGAAGAAGAGAVHHGRDAAKQISDASKLGHVPQKRLAGIARSRGKAAGLGALAVGGVVAGNKIGQKKKTTWQPYSKALVPAATTAKKPGLNGGMKALRPMPKFKPLGQRPVSPNVKAMRPVQVGGAGQNTAGLSGVGKSSAWGIEHY